MCWVFCLHLYNPVLKWIIVGLEGTSYTGRLVAWSLFFFCLFPSFCCHVFFSVVLILDLLIFIYNSCSEGLYFNYSLLPPYTKMLVPFSAKEEEEGENFGLNCPCNIKPNFHVLQVKCFVLALLHPKLFSGLSHMPFCQLQALLIRRFLYPGELIIVYGCMLVTIHLFIRNINDSC